MLDELRDQDHLTRTQRNYYKEICAAINTLTIELSRSPTDDEIAKFTHLTISEVDKYIGMGSEIVSLYQEFEDGLSYQDVIADNVTLSPLESAHNSLAIDKLREYFRELDEREQKLLFLRHYEDMSVKEIAKVLEISEGRISQLYQKIVLKLRALMNVT
jgi:RNA polymerase sigma factor for flagellar operon FliA